MSILQTHQKCTALKPRMKRLSNTCSFIDGGDFEETNANLMIPIYSSSAMQSRVKYEEKSQSFLVERVDEEEEEEEDELNGQISSAWLREKKRRLGTEQVKTLERHFEVENKLDPERKVRLAQEIGLQPRQVAVWFQNRRARWKTKQLERDYSALEARHGSLKLDCDNLRTEKETLTAEIRELKAKLTSTTMAVAAETTMETRNETVDQEDRPAALMYKDGACDSDSSVVFNDETSPYNSGAAALEHRQSFDQMGIFKAHFSVFSFQGKSQGCTEERFLNPVELCSSLFSEDQAPTFSWNCSDRCN